MLGLDAGDPVLLERWAADGTLPHLRRILAEGTSGRLATSAAHLAGSPWPTFYTGQPPSVHGIYHDFQWRHETMSYASPGGGWLPVRPFWRALVENVDVVACDVPMVPGCEPFGGTEISGWASHDKLAPPQSHPAELADEVRRRLGEWPIPPESYGRDDVVALLELRDRLLESTRRSAELALHLLERPWSLAVVAFGALHRGGHRFWDRSSLQGPVTEPAGEAFDRALRDLYVGCDQAVGRLRAAAPDATTVVFSLHGMTANASRVDLLEAMLARVLHPSDGRRTRRGLVRRAGEALPLRWRRALTSRVPSGLRDRLTTVWSTGGVRWEETPAFALRADLQGYVRLNLAGREIRGIVEPGPDAERLRERVSEGLQSFRDARTGEAFVADVVPIERACPPGDRRDRLPDLVVRWRDTAAAPHAAVRSPTFGVVERETPGRIPGGRSGNHRPEGFFAAAGPGIPRGGRLPSGADIVDLAPTALALLGTRAAVPLAGRPLFGTAFGTAFGEAARR